MEPKDEGGELHFPLVRRDTPVAIIRADSQSWLTDEYGVVAVIIMLDQDDRFFKLQEGATGNVFLMSKALISMIHFLSGHEQDEIQKRRDQAMSMTSTKTPSKLFPV